MLNKLFCHILCRDFNLLFWAIYGAECKSFVMRQKKLFYYLFASLSGQTSKHRVAFSCLLVVNRDDWWHYTVTIIHFKFKDNIIDLTLRFKDYKVELLDIQVHFEFLIQEIANSALKKYYGSC